MGERSISKQIAWAFAIAPVVLFLVTWDQELTPIQRQARTFAYPIVAVEIAVIFLSALQGVRLSRPPAWVSGAILTLLSIAWATAISAEFAPASIIRTTLWTVHLLFGLAIANLVTAGSISAEDFPPAIAAGFVAFAALIFVFVAVNYRTGYNWIEAMPAFSNLRWFGYYAAAVVGLSVTDAARGSKWHWFVVALAVGCAVWTGSRGTLFAVVSGYCVALVFFPQARTGWARFAAAAFAGVVLSAALTLIIPIGDGTARLSEVGSNGRVELWKFTLTFIEHRPFFGWGEEQLRFMPAPIDVVHPHNVILQVLLAWGAIGLLLVASLLTWLARRVLLASDSTLPSAMALAMIAAFSMIDGSLYHVQSVATFALLLALASAHHSVVDHANP